MSIIQEHGRGYVFTPKDFLDLGSREAIDTALSRLTTNGDIRRLARGLYDYPKQNKLLGDLYPDPDYVAQVIARDLDSQIQISGARAMHMLGLTTQVPAQTVYLISGPSKEIKIGGVVLKFKHASPKIMAGSGTKGGIVLQAIRYLGKNGITNRVLDKISHQLDNADKQSIKNLIRFAPGWAKPSFDKLLAA